VFKSSIRPEMIAFIIRRVAAHARVRHCRVVAKVAYDIVVCPTAQSMAVEAL